MTPTDHHPNQTGLDPHSNNHPSSGLQQTSEHIVLTAVRPNGPTAVGKEEKELLNLDSQNRPSKGAETKADYQYYYNFFNILYQGMETSTWTTGRLLVTDRVRGGFGKIRYILWL